MKRLGIAGLASSAAALSTVAFTNFGGWAVATVESVPDYIVAGKPVDLTFTVRQHGYTLRSDLKPSIEAKSGWRTVSGSAWALSAEGMYRGTITVPSPGDWTITVNSG